MRYAMLIAGDEKAWENVTEAESQASMTEVYAWFEKWSAAGKIADGGVQLQPSSTARTLRGGTSGAVVTDGPYIEAKEIIGGVVLLECDNVDEAVEVASTWPGLSDDSVAVEVRPTVDHSGM